ncbi:MAG: FtsQ-type POTRA domain-containing protein [Arenicellales bacterium]
MPKAVVSMTPPISGVSAKFKLVISLVLGVAAFSAISVLVVDRLYNPQYFNISQISLTGDAAHVDRKTLTESVSKMIEGNYFSVNSKKILSALHTLPWVETARIRRQWPDTLMVNIEEYQPVAHWGERRWLTTTGKLVELPLPKNIILPHLSGPKDQVPEVWEKYQQWAKLFSQNGLNLRKVHLSKQHLYTLEVQYSGKQSTQKVAKGFEMILLESNASQQLKTFLSSRQQALIETPNLIKMVDLRYPSGFSVSHYKVNNVASFGANEGLN